MPLLNGEARPGLDAPHRATPGRRKDAGTQIGVNTASPAK